MQKNHRSTPDGLWVFLALTFALTWAFWLIIPLLGMGGKTFPGVLLYMLGGCWPSIIGVILFNRYSSKEERRDFWRRAVDAKRVRPAWYALILLGLPALTLLAIALDGMITGGSAGFDAVKQIAAQPAFLLGILIPGLLFGPLSEELGWRGFALDRMSARWGLPKASLILGVIWWAWHLPLFLIPGTTHNAWGLGTVEFWAFLPTVVALSVVVAWAYAANGRSLFAAILLHFTYPVVLGLVVPVTGGMLVTFAVLLAAWAAALVVRWKKRQVEAAAQTAAQA